MMSTFDGEMDFEELFICDKDISYLEEKIESLTGLHYITAFITILK